MRNIEFDVVPGSTAQSGTMEDRLNYFINMREDYAGDCECNLSIDGLVVRSTARSTGEGITPLRLTLSA